jgi:hypothetical protein
MVFLGDVMTTSDRFRKAYLVSRIDMPTVPRALAKLLLARIRHCFANCGRCQSVLEAPPYCERAWRDFSRAQAEHPPSVPGDNASSATARTGQQPLDTIGTCGWLPDLLH